MSVQHYCEDLYAGFLPPCANIAFLYLAIVHQSIFRGTIQPSDRTSPNTVWCGNVNLHFTSINFYQDNIKTL